MDHLEIFLITLLKVTPNSAAFMIEFENHNMKRLSVPQPSSPMIRSLSYNSLSFDTQDSKEEKVPNPTTPSVGGLVLVSDKKLEKHWPSKKVSVWVVTWNMNCQIPRSQNDLYQYLAKLKNAKGGEPDIVAFGTQETAAETSEWNTLLQAALGPSHVLFHSAALGMLYLSVFIKRELIWFTSIPEERAYSTRIGAKYKTKGAIAICFMLFGTSFLFVNSHLTAHDDKIE